MKKINILGTDYDLVVADIESRPKLGNCDGYMDYSIKEICIKDLTRIAEDPNSIDDLELYKKKVIRHEIIHAFLYESGLWENSGVSEAWGQDETITDWIAIQAPKIFKTFQEADAL